MTFYGALLLGVEATLIAIGADFPKVEPIVSFLGIFLTAFGFRKAMK